ncbi:OmpH family outer membrane protein [Caenispirillum salinarum]|uniref:OmpH family outer membrane protein n=1 Tax=Caenispirillum salinarum TaxID=859058 RepID=UPI00384FE64D
MRVAAFGVRRRVRVVLTALAVCCAVLGTVAPGGSRAQSETAGAEAAVPKPVVGVIDLQRVLREADAAQGVRQKREEYVTDYQADAAQVEQELRAADQELARLRATADQQEFAEKRSAFQKRVAQSQRDVQTRRRNLERAFGQAMSAVQQGTIRIADQIAAEKGVNVILYRSQVFLFDNAMDLTDEILQRLDARMPTVEFPDPETMADSAAKEPVVPDAMTGD